MDARRRVKPEDLVEMREQQIALSLLLSGQFDERIAELRKANSDLESNQLVLRTLAEAEQIKHAAVQFSEGERVQVVGIVEKAEADRGLLLEALATAKALLGRAEQEKDATALGWIELEREKNRREHLQDKGEAELKRRQEIVAEKEAGLSAEYDRLRLLQDKLKFRLAKLESVDAL